MLAWLVAESLRLRVLVVALAALLLVLGWRALGGVSLDVFPEFAPPMIELQTEAPGLSTEEVEALVTVPLENALQGIPSLRVLRSKSVLGLSSVVMVLEPGTDALRTRELVQERLAQASLPAVAAPPVILPPLSSTSRVLKIGMTSQKLDRGQLSELARWVVRPRLMAVRGVADVSIWGLRDSQIQVLVDPERLRLLDLSLDQVWAATADAAAVSGGGFIDTPAQRLAVRWVSPVIGPEDLARTIVAWRDSTPLRLGDVATVRLDHAPPIGEAVIGSGPGLLLIVGKDPTGNTLDVTRGIDAALAALRPALADVEIDATIFRPATFIERAVANLEEALVAGCVLVVVVLLLFLSQPRAALISIVAIPLSLLAATLALLLAGQTINCMTLAGLVIAVGVVVDDAIIDVENILRRLRLAPADGGPSPLSIVLAASLEVRSAVVSGSLIVILVFIPVFFLPGLAGAFFRPLAAAYVIAIAASLTVAVTVTPAMSLLLLPRVAATDHGEGRVVVTLKRGYRRLLPAFVEHPRRSIGVLVAALLGALTAAPFLGEEFLPEFQETDFLMHWVEKPGTSLEATQRAAVLASRELCAIPGVRNFGAHIGRAAAGDEVVGPNFAELWISVDPEVDQAETLARVQEVVDGYPGLQRDVLTYLRERVKEVLTGAGASLVVRIYGPELPVLRERARAVAEALEDVDGAVDLKLESLIVVPQVEVRLRPEAVARFGLTPGAVRRAASTLVQGTKVGEVYHGQLVREVAVWSEPHVRRNLTAIRELELDGPDGQRVRLGDVADVTIVPSPNEIKRERASRRIDVSLNVRGRDLGSVAREVEARLARIEFPTGYHPELLGEWAEREQSQRALLTLSLAALAGIVLLVHQGLGSGRKTALFLLTLPFALVGGVGGAFLSGGDISLGSIVGFVTVMGIASRNGLLLLDHYRYLEHEEGVPFGLELILRGAEERLAPILMTALCAGLALVPIVARGEVPGHEIERPMAMVILCGLTTSTLLSLFLTPAIYAAIRRRWGAA